MLQFMGRRMMGNRLCALCQSFSLQVNLQWRNLANAINQMIQVSITSNETQRHHGPPTPSTEKDTASLCVILAKNEKTSGQAQIEGQFTK